MGVRGGVLLHQDLSSAHDIDALLHLVQFLTCEVEDSGPLFRLPEGSGKQPALQREPVELGRERRDPLFKPVDPTVKGADQILGPGALRAEEPAGQADPLGGDRRSVGAAE